MGEVSGLVAERMGLHFPEERWPDLARGLRGRGPGAGLRGSRRLPVLAQDPGADGPADRDARQPPDRGRDLLLPGPGELRGARAGDPAAARRRAAPRRAGPSGCGAPGAAPARRPTPSPSPVPASLPDLADWNVSILATDINPTFLAKAEAGVYSRLVVPRHARLASRAVLLPRARQEARHRSGRQGPGPLRLPQPGRGRLPVAPQPHQRHGRDLLPQRPHVLHPRPPATGRGGAAPVPGGRRLSPGQPRRGGASLFPMFATETVGGVLLYRKTQPPRAEPWPVLVSPARARCAGDRARGPGAHVRFLRRARGPGVRVGLVIAPRGCPAVGPVPAPCAGLRGPWTIPWRGRDLRRPGSARRSARLVPGGDRGRAHKLHRVLSCTRRSATSSAGSRKRSPRWARSSTSIRTSSSPTTRWAASSGSSASTGSPGVTSRSPSSSFRQRAGTSSCPSPTA